MKKSMKYISMALISILLVCCFFVMTSYGVSEQLTQAQLENSNAADNKENIGRIVLKDTGRDAVFESDEVMDVAVYFGDLLGNGQEQAVVAVSLGLKNTVLAVYTKDKTGDTYTYVNDVGDFFEVDDVLFLPLKGDGTNIMIVQEFSDQNIGAYEKSSFFKGYIWDEETNDFENVLSIPEGIEAIWNGRWDDSGENRWQKIEERSAFETEESEREAPSLRLLQYQAYRISESTDRNNIPDDSTFYTAQNRVVTETYYWDDTWRRFILSEKKDKNTGETVAVIEDFASSPYVLVKEYDTIANTLLIQRKNGTIEAVSKDALVELDGTELQSAFFSYGAQET